jgi:thioredoxin reductase (NADPH)
MMHYAALLAESRHDMAKQGWTPDMEQKHDWEAMIKSVQTHIKGLNWGYKTDLMKL